MNNKENAATEHSYYKPGVANARELLDVSFEMWGDRPFLRGVSEFSFKEVSRLTRQIAAKYSRHARSNPGRPIAILAENGSECILGILAAIWSGSPFSVMSPSSHPTTLRKMLQNLRPAFVLTDRYGANSIPPNMTLPRLDLVENGRLVGCATDAPADSTIPCIAADQPACMIYTSGSTGEPRAVVATHDNIVFTTDAILQRLQYKPDDIIGLFLPLTFDFALYQLLLAARSGASIYVDCRRGLSADLVHRLGKFEISVLPVVPGLLGSVVKLLTRSQLTLSSLRSVTSTGDHLPHWLVEELHKRHPKVDVYRMYGLTECKRVSILLPSETSKTATVGRPLDDTRCQILALSGEEADVGEIGELYVTGRNVTNGYWRAPEETRKRFELLSSGMRRLRTGDLCSVDSEGFITLVGRSDELLKHRGYRMSALEIEAAAGRIPGVIESCALRSSTADELVLYVKLLPGQTDATEILNNLRSSIDFYKVPDRVCIVKSFPRTASGKINRDAVLDKSFDND